MSGSGDSAVPRNGSAISSLGSSLECKEWYMEMANSTALARELQCKVAR